MSERVEISPSRVFIETDESGSRLVVVVDKDEIAKAFGAYCPNPTVFTPIIESASIDGANLMFVTEERLAVWEEGDKEDGEVG